jgi:hypothetical protein
MIASKAIVGPRVDLAIDYSVEFAGGRLILRSCIDTDNEAADNDQRQNQLMPAHGSLTRWRLFAKRGQVTVATVSRDGYGNLIRPSLVLVSGGLTQRKRLEFHEPVPFADVDEQRRRALATGEVERATLLAVEAGDLSRIQHETNTRGRRR